MKIRISRDVVTAIARQARKDAPRECCGLLLATNRADFIDIALAAPNVADTPTNRFEVDPAILIAAHRAQRVGGPAVLGCYHSHPSGTATPSPTDAAMAAPDGSLWLITAGDPAHSSLWRASTNGVLHGRFDPVPLEFA